MNTRLIIGNIVCFIGSVIMVSVGLIKKKDKILWAQCVQFGVLGTGNLILGGISGAISDYLSIIRNLVSLKREFTLVFKFIFIAIQIVLTAIFNNAGIYGWLPTAAACIFTWCLDTKNEILLKLLIILAQAMWGLYDIKIKNYTTLAFDVMTGISNMIGIFMILTKKNKAVAAEQNLQTSDISASDMKEKASEDSTASI